MNHVQESLYGYENEKFFTKLNEAGYQDFGGEKDKKVEDKANKMK